jgi:hypothetical protein
MNIPAETVGPILGGIAGVITASATLFGVIIPLSKKWRKADKKEIIDHFDKRVWRIVEQRMRDAAKTAGPANTYVIRIKFLEGLEFAVPLTRDWIEIDPCGAQIQLLEDFPGETRYQLRCPHPYQITTHEHVEQETVEVQYGTMTDMTTGKVYRKGEAWTVPANEAHAVFFSACSSVIITVRPPLPTMVDVPLNLRHLEQITSASS